MANLFESYKGRLALAEKCYAKAHQGAQLGDSKKLIIAKTLENTNRFLNEAFENSVGTQRSDLGLFKKFALNLTNVVLPNLIAFDLVIVQPMSSMSGYINYIQYVKGSNKGESAVGDLINDPFKLGKVDPTYTSSKVIETKAIDTTSTRFYTLGQAPVIPGTLTFDVAGGDSSGEIITHYLDDGNGKLYSYVDGAEVSIVESVVTSTKDASGHLEGVAPKIVKTITGAVECGTVAYGMRGTAGVSGTGAEPIYDNSGAAAITFNEGVVVTGNVAIKYQYNNVAIPQNDLPMVTAQMKAIPLIAKARRVAIYYSQIAAFQAKSDYGFDLGQQLAEKAAGQLSYEIDTEVVDLLDATAGEAQTSLRWNRNLPTGVNMTEHYASFAETVAIARQIIYERTQRFAPNYMIVAADVLPVLGFAKGFTPAPAGNINGPYLAGTFDGIKVFVSPRMRAGRFVVGVNGNDMMSSVAVYAPYMPIVPTQLLGFSDGGMTQGFSTLYALEVLNEDLIVAGEIFRGDYNTYIGTKVENVVG